MSRQSLDFHLIEREDLQKERQEARRRVMQAAFLGAEIDIADLAKMRGLAIRESEDSILSDAWIVLALIILIIGLIDDLNPALITLGLVLLIILVAGTIWKNLALVGVLYRRSFDRTRVFPNEPVEMTIKVTNNKRLPLTWLRFQDSLPVNPDTINVLKQTVGDTSEEYFLVNSFSMHAREEVKRSTTMRFPSRGFYKLGPTVYQSGDIFTLYRVEREYENRDTIVVYPKVYPLEEFGLPAKEPFGDLKVFRSLFTDPIRTRGVRDYQPQDRFRDVHWKATARRGQLQTKIYDPSTSMTLGIFLNVATMPKHWMGFFPEVMEQAVSVAASIANYGAELGWGIGFYANGAYPNSDQSIRVPPGRSTDQLTHILEAVAAVTEFATTAIEIMLLRESPNLPWVATIVLVTAVVTDEIMVALLRLQEAGRRVVLLSLAEEPPPKELGHILAYHLPPGSIPSLQDNGPYADESEDDLVRVEPG